jgi:hypothetical protein
MPMPKTLTTRLDDGVHQASVRAAKAERRSLANLVEPEVWPRYASAWRRSAQIMPVCVSLGLALATPRRYALWAMGQIPSREESL